MKKKCIHFDEEKYNGAEKFLNRIAQMLSSFADEFNNRAREDLKIVDEQSLVDAFYTPETYLRDKVSRNAKFEISGTELAVEKAFELGLLKMPGESSSLINLSNTWRINITELFDHPLAPFPFKFKCFILNDARQVNVNLEFLEEFKEACRSYINPDKEEEYKHLVKLIEFVHKDIPNHPGNVWDKLNTYIHRNLKVVHQGDKNGHQLIPDPKVFSEGFVHGSSTR